MKRSAPPASADLESSKRTPPAPPHRNDPVSLIDIDDTTMSLSPAAREMLIRTGQRGRPLMTVCVVGKARTGKSFLLNRGLMGRVGADGRGFQVSPSTRACTKGMWIAGPPVPAVQFWGKLGISPPADADLDYDVLVIDTEGISALDRDQTYDRRIFTLALLLSSCFIFNSLGAIDEQAIESLSAIAAVAESLKEQNRGRGRRASDESAVQEMLDLPSFLWVVRDFGLDIERESTADDEREVLTDDQYLEEALRIDPRLANTSKGAMRKVLVKAFPRRHCQTMVRPTELEEDLKQLQDLPDARLRPKFQAQLASFRTKLLALARTKRAAGQPVDAAVFVDLVQNYLEAINSNQVPTVLDAWTQVMRARCERGVQEAVEQLQSFLAPLLEGPGGGAAAESAEDPCASLPPAIVHPSLFYMHITSGLRRADAIYRECVRGVPDTSMFDKVLQEKLFIAVGSAAHRWKDVVERSSQVAVRRLLAQAEGGADVDAEDGEVSLARLMDAVPQAVPPLSRSDLPAPEYSDNIPAMLEDTVRDMVLDGARGWWLSKLQTAVRREWQASATRHTLEGAAAKRKAMEELQARFDTAMAEVNDALEAWRERAAEAEKRASEAEQQVQSVRAEMDEIRAASEAERQQEAMRRDMERRDGDMEALRELEATLETKHREMVASLEEELDARHSELDEVSAELKKTNAQLSETKRSLHLSCEEVAALKSAVQQERDRSSEAVRSAQAVNAKLQEKLTGRMVELQKIMETQGEQRMEWASKLRESENERSRAEAQVVMLQAKVQKLEASADEIHELHRRLRETELTLARAEAERKLAQGEIERLNTKFNERERELFDGLRTVREMQRRIRA